MKSLYPFETDVEDDILCLEPSENNCDYQKGLIPDENEPPSLLLQGLISCMAATVEGNPDKYLVTSLFPHPCPGCESDLSNFSITLETGIDRFFPPNRVGGGPCFITRRAQALAHYLLKPQESGFSEQGSSVCLHHETSCHI